MDDSAVDQALEIGRHGDAHARGYLATSLALK
jgi:hypothetical protein